MKFQIELLPEAKTELFKIEKADRNKAIKDYRTIEEYGSEFTNIKALQDNLYEIKSDNIRSLFTYKKGQVIIIALVFIKKSQKTPKKYINQATKRLNDYE